MAPLQQDRLLIFDKTLLQINVTLKESFSS